MFPSSPGHDFLHSDVRVHAVGAAMPGDRFRGESPGALQIAARHSAAGIFDIRQFAQRVSQTHRDEDQTHHTGEIQKIFNK